MYYQILAADKYYIGIVWQYADGKPLIEKIFLPCPRSNLLTKIKKEYAAINITERRIPNGLAKQIAGFYAGEKINFDFSLLHLKKLSDFAANVLKQTCKIPRGKVTTYSKLAAKTGRPLAARAVGTALANNPFPLIIPCHRVVRADGSLGGFGGGSKMKKELLAKEEVTTDDRGCVSAKYFSDG